MKGSVGLSWLGFHLLMGLGFSSSVQAESAVATFAGGCFWCVEKAYEEIPGVTEVVSGYTGGDEADPTYRQVSSGSTGHTEAVQVYYDPEQVEYAGLIQALWRMMDPTDNDGQFVDRGRQYRPAIFYANERERKIAEAAKTELAAANVYDESISIEITPLGEFYEAEDYHQDYYQKNPIRYRIYTFNSGRFQYVEEYWGSDYADTDYSQFHDADYLEFKESNMSDTAKNVAQKPTPWESFDKPSDEQLRESLTDLQYEVTQNDATERAFDNPYNDEKSAGIYVDIVSGEPLFSSDDKYDSGTGWPSFSQPINDDVVVTTEDRKWFMKRIEVSSAIADSHLGHVFTDGPEPTGLRYCLNSAALRFVPLADMVAEGYGDYVKYVEHPDS